ncbi:MAG: D-glycero-beta-D-manno-heptose-7-phosphate kinase [Methylobacterium sp.]|jgi:D-beta-D-heptose 7-phosphate kinase/D-beta-D-heptose 1-phosphate adenosyltransferase|nr:D-glycero-beta-D-manno-heptose-7-phosphate kinase [Methylobacterium sp.]
MNFQSYQILVVGDAILDIYCEGSVSRVSPEAPVPVVHVRNDRFVPGGAVNVAANIASMGGQAEVVALLGTDIAASTLTEFLAEQHPHARLDHCIRSANRPTTTKTRILGNQHQIVRLDRETAIPILAEIEAAMVERIAQRLPHCNYVILSDYSKGVCTDRVITETIRLAKESGRPVLVDPKRKDFSIYRGATFIKPNTRELSLATGLPCETDREVEIAAARIVELTGANLIVTRSEHGMSLISTEGHIVHIGAVARDVFDVSGAGDTVIAALALALSSGAPIDRCLSFANTAAAVVIGKIGTATVTLAEIEQQLAASGLTPAGTAARLHSRSKIVTREEARARIAAWKTEGYRVGFTNGCFDLLHPGHIQSLEMSAAECDKLVVALNTDASVQRLKGPTRPLQNEQARARVMASLGMVDLVVLFGEDTPLEIIADLLPDVLVKGADYRIEEVVGADIVRGNGGKVVLVDLVAGESTTAITRKMQS